MTNEYQPFASKMRQDLYKSLKLISAAEGTSIQNLLEEAITQYLANRRFIQETLEVRESETRYSISFDVSEKSNGRSSKKRSTRK
ncbi:MAG: hypothetical protein JRI80_12470 [Deltaproteobacteria bacterium]|nr:hypothetical protein [Deltaproteobacteria bacterium]